MEQIEQEQPLAEIPQSGGEAVVENDPTQPTRLQTFMIELLETVVLALVMFAIINFTTARIRVDGPSMEPTFAHNNYVIVNRMSYVFGEIDRGDVIVFHFPRNPEEDYIKRVIALAGDTIMVQAGVVYVNGAAIEEPYIKNKNRRDEAEIRVPDGNVYVMGDNRNNSSDSRSWGPLPVESILGKAVFIYWPFIDIDTVDHASVMTAVPE